MSILLDWESFAIDGPRDGHLGLGFPDTLRAADRTAYTRGGVRRLVAGGPQGAQLPPEAAPFFRLDRVGPGDSLEAGFGVLVVTEGEGELRAGSGPVHVGRGSTVVIPHAAGNLEVVGPLHALWSRPPAPTS